MSLAESINRLKEVKGKDSGGVSAPIVEFAQRLTSEEEAILNIKFVKQGSSGAYLYTSAIPENELVDPMDFCSRMFDWDVVKAEFKKRGINVLGPDKHVIMSRALNAYRETTSVSNK